MHNNKFNLSVWLLLFLVIESLSLAGDLAVRHNIDYTLEMLAVYTGFSFTISQLYTRNFKYTSISILLGIIAGQIKVYFISYMEGLSGLGTMNAAYALFGCICRGIVIGSAIELISISTRKTIKEGKKNIGRYFYLQGGGRK